MSSPDASPSVRLDAVTKRYGDVVAVRSTTLEVPRGRFFSLLGPSGCGKTTTLRMIAGFEEPTAGVISIDGRDVTGVPPHRRDVNTVFQSYALFPHLTVYDNVAFGLRRRRVARAEVAERVGQTLETVRLSGYDKRRPSQLSGGQQQRVALARALVNLPAVLLLDEPLGALDLKLRKQLQIELKQIQREVGITFVYVTHDQEEALTMSDSIAVMNEGVVQQIGGPEDIYERPDTPFVADFIGVSNLLAGTAGARREAAQEVSLADGSLLLGEPRAQLRPGDACAVVVRPEKLALHETHERPERCAAPLRGTISATLYLGTTTQYTVDLAGGGSLVVLEQNSERASDATIWQPGQEALVAWSASHVLLLPQAGDVQDPLIANQATAQGDTT